MKAFRRIWGIVTTLAVIAVVVLAILLVGVRVVGLTPYAVLSGSMEPTYHVGSLIYVRKVAPEEVKIGDPIEAPYRVIEKTKDEETGEETTVEVPLDEPAYYYQTKGDANADVDGAPGYYKNLSGEPVFSIPYLGYLSSALQTKKGMILGVTAALVLLLLLFMPDILRSADESDKKSAGKGKKPKRS